MNKMFFICENLYELDTSNFNNNKVITLEVILRRCDNLKELKISNFNNNNITNMSNYLNFSYIIIFCDIVSFLFFFAFKNYI